MVSNRARDTPARLSYLSTPYSVCGILFENTIIKVLVNSRKNIKLKIKSKRGGQLNKTFTFQTYRKFDANCGGFHTFNAKTADRAKVQNRRKQYRDTQNFIDKMRGGYSIATDSILDQRNKLCK